MSSRAEIIREKLTICAPNVFFCCYDVCAVCVGRMPAGSFWGAVQPDLRVSERSQV